MFNAPRSTGTRYLSAADSLGASFVDENPLAGSAYDGVDPWSAAPSPSPPPFATSQPSSVFDAAIADATVPSIYHRAFALVDPDNSGETSVASLSRVLGTSSLPAATIDKIANLVSSRPRVSKLEFFVALALVALAQAGKDVSIEQVAALSSQNTLPEPRLELDALPPSTSTFTNLRQDTLSSTPVPAAPSYSTDDPWNTAARFSPATNAGRAAFNAQSGFGASGFGTTNGAPSNLAGSGLPKDWWKRQETVKVTLQGQQGFILNRYFVYQVTSDRGPSVTRRYSEFSYLWDCLTRRYPFRLFPALPPKRIGPDEHFIEQRRRGLSRALDFVINHPIMKDDGLLASFLTEPSFDTWRKTTAVSLEEESASKRVDRVEEMSIPSDLEDKISVVRGRVSSQIELWQRICILVERLIKRREAAAVRIPAFRRAYLPTHFALPLFYSSSDSALRHPPLLSSAASSMSSSSIIGMINPPASSLLDSQSDMSRLTNTLRVVAEVTEQPWRSPGNELSLGIRQGIENIAAHTQRQSELWDLRSRTLLDTTLESLKAQRDLYIATRDLFVRHEHLSKDSVERLKKRVEINSQKLDTIRQAKKEGWQEEADKIVGTIEKDQSSITAQLNRRVFIRACIWHELRVILHNRENTLLTLAVQSFVRDEQEFSENVLNTWTSLTEAVENMPVE